MKPQSNAQPINVIFTLDDEGTKTTIAAEFETTTLALPQLQAIANTDLFWEVLYRIQGEDYYRPLYPNN